MKTPNETDVTEQPEGDARGSHQRLVSLSKGEILMLYRAMKTRSYDLKVMYHTIDDPAVRAAIWSEMERMEVRSGEIHAQANS
jgi:hypothetical protein